MKLKIGTGGNHGGQFQIYVENTIKVGFDTRNSICASFMHFGRSRSQQKAYHGKRKDLSIICEFQTLANIHLVKILFPDNDSCLRALKTSRRKSKPIDPSKHKLKAKN